MIFQNSKKISQILKTKMKKGSSISPVEFRVVWSETPHELDHSGYADPKWLYTDSFEEAVDKFNALLADEKTQVADLSLGMTYTAAGRVTKMYGNHFWLAKFNRKDPTIVSHALSQNYWECTKGRLSGQVPEYYRPDGSRVYPGNRKMPREESGEPEESEEPEEPEEPKTKKRKK